jgi:beta-fructofuranosidase
MLDPAETWVWDFWHVRQVDTHHLFYLQAPKSLGDPELRHRNATIGHATSTNLRDWTEHGTVLRPGGAGAIDATATWTGCIVQGDDGLWRMFYTGSVFLDAEDNSNIETIAVAVSADLFTWQKDAAFKLEADPTWYERLGDSSWPEQAWRDPWVYHDGERWRMLITARSSSGDVDDRGVVGHAHSTDLITWETTAPLTEPGEGFAQLEVFQRIALQGGDFVVFSSHRLTLTERRLAGGGETGTWIAPIDEERIRLDEAANLTGPDLYSGRIIELDGNPVLLAFRTVDADGNFLGGITDPIPVVIRDGRPHLTHPLTSSPARQ